jgi:Lrp/AsnC family leucine-responsive transcriptional regulator
MNIDRIDKRILAVLQTDGRLAAVELADRVGLSPTSTGDRVKRLQKEGYITGFGARLDPHRLGLGLLVFVEIILETTSPEVFQRFSLAVNRAPEVLECHMIAGGFDYLVKARVKDMRAYRRFLSEGVLSLPGVKEARSYVVVDEVKEASPLPL